MDIEIWWQVPVLQFISTAYIFQTLHTNPRIAHKMQNTSHLLQNEAKYHKHISKANIFAIILTPVSFLCVT